MAQRVKWDVIALLVGAVVFLGTLGFCLKYQYDVTKAAEQYEKEHPKK